MFSLILKAFVCSVVSILAMFLITKMLGNRQVSQMNLFDYINGITIGSIAADLAISEDSKQAFYKLCSLIIYGLIVAAISVLTLHNEFLKKIFSGQTLMLIDNGKIYDKNLKAAKIEINELLSSARSAGYFDISQVSYAVLESNGKISFMPASDSRPATPKDLSVNVPSEVPPKVVIHDGIINQNNLKITGNNDKWLKDNLSKQGYSNPSQIILATVDGNNKLTVFPKRDEINTNDYFN